MNTPTMQRYACLSDCGRYRYTLIRHWGPLPPSLWAAAEALIVVMLNPSTANHLIDDPTVGRCVGFAEREGKRALIVLNLYGLRATSPTALLTAADPVGPLNDGYLIAYARMARESGAPVLAAWGMNAKPDRVAAFRRIFHGVDLRCLGVTKAGHPRHPLYVRGDQPLVPWPVLA